MRFLSRSLVLALMFGLVYLPILLLSSCTPDESRGGIGATVQDTGGAEVVVSSGHASDGGQELRVAEAPELEIGGVDGNPKYELFRVTGATRLADGGIAIAHAGTEIRFYDRHGRYVSSTGGTGDGPGEFRSLWGLWPYRGDSLVAWDRMHRRATIVGSNGKAARQMRIDAAGANARLLGSFADGSVVLGNGTLDFSGNDVKQQTMELTLHGPDGVLRGPLGTVPSFRTIVVRSGSSPYIGSPRFSPRTSFAVTDSFLYVGRATASEVEVRRANGDTFTRISWPEGNRAVEQRHIRASKAAELESIEGEEARRQRRAIQDQIPSEDVFPAYEWIIADRVGRLWVELFRRPGERDDFRWKVFDQKGRVLGEFSLPKGFSPMEIGRDYMLGLQLDELGVERIRMYRLEM